MSESREDDPGGGEQHPDPENEHQAGDVLDLAVESEHGEGGDASRHQFHSPAVLEQAWPKESGVLRHANAAGSNLERAAE